MDRIIVGIHGLNNKVDCRTLKNWWQLSIYEGIKGAGLKMLPVNFELLYWADLLYPSPLLPHITDENHPLYLSKPYKKTTSSIAQRDSRLRSLMLNRLEQVTDRLFKYPSFFNRFSDISTQLLYKRFRDFYDYMYGKTGFHDAASRPVRQVIQERLVALLRRHHRRKICIMAHSMGSIIVYDVLTQTPDLPEIELLITMGSPLGQPALLKNLNLTFEKIQTPPQIKEWHNLADLHDIIAFNYSLSDDFLPNANAVAPVDHTVHNAYTWEGAADAHNIFGYLQTQNCASLISLFLRRERHPVALAVTENMFNLYLRWFQPFKRMRAASPVRPESAPRKRKSIFNREEQFDHQIKN
ncbi:MAG: hypothetical protein EHM72_11425 [Calditrichaeota bacterium]|nr:MAG: hypothetical protein EHM72_11425 [Calditrichota bacterium]